MKACATWSEVLEKLKAKSFTDCDRDCLIWTGPTAGKGYGVISWQGKQTLIHRLVYEQFHHVKPDVVRHSCDNPRCWNIMHLSNGTHADNVEDKLIKGRHGLGNSKLTVKQVQEIKNSNLSNNELGKLYNVGPGAIRHIRVGNSWRHVQ